MFYYIILFILWACFWSFSTVLISRFKSWKWWIMLGRSECPHCNHTLGAMELIPMFSWIFQWGKCKNCRAPISSYYPLSEIIMWSVFVLIGYISLWLGFPIVSFITIMLLFWWFVTVIYIIYDIRYTEIPDQIMIPAILITIISLGLPLFWSDYIFFFDYYSYKNFHTFLTDHIIAAIWVYSFFFLQIVIPWTYYLIKNKKYSKLSWLYISYFIFPIIILIDYFRWAASNEEEEEEIPVWIWGWDLRIALFIGLTLGTLHSISTLIFAYILGSVVWIFILTYAKIYKKNISHMIPFWPFLWAWWFLSLVFYDAIIRYSELINL